MIIGNPTLDSYGGVETMRRYVWIAGVWLSRHSAPKCSKWSLGHPQSKRTHAICSMFLDEIKNFEPSCNFFLQKPQTVRPGGWQFITTYWNPHQIIALIGLGYQPGSTTQPPRDTLWLERGAWCHPLKSPGPPLGTQFGFFSESF